MGQQHVAIPHTMTDGSAQVTWARSLCASSVPQWLEEEEEFDMLRNGPVVAPLVAYGVLTPFVAPLVASVYYLTVICADLQLTLPHRV